MHKKRLNAKRGDTLLEVVFAFVIFSLVSVLSITTMNSGIKGAEAALELSLARTEIDAQAETLRFIQSVYAYDKGYRTLWKALTLDDSTKARSVVLDKTEEIPTLNTADCAPLYSQTDSGIYSAHAFILNSRAVISDTDTSPDSSYSKTLVLSADDIGKTESERVFRNATLNPRVVYTSSETSESSTDDALKEDSDGDSPVFDTIMFAEGIYDLVVKDTEHSIPNYYDFYIQTCWTAPGALRATTIGTVIRLYNPEFLDA